MSLTIEKQQYYIDIIHKLYPHLSHHTAEDVNEEVAGLVCELVAEIDKGSQGLAAVQTLITSLYDWFKAKNLWELSKEAVKTLFDVLDKLQTAPAHRYRLVVRTAAMKYRSIIELALMNL